MRVAVVTNPAAGANADPSVGDIREALEAAGVQCELCEAHGTNLRDETNRAIQSRPDAIVAAGGDGTVSSVAAQLVSSQIPLGVLPTGTLNHFAKDLGIPLELDAAASVIGAAKIRSIDLAQVNDRIFINNSSIGLYPQVIQKRDEIRERLGRGKWISMLMSTISVFRRHPLVNVRINSEKLAFARKTAFVFIGNNHYEISLTMLGKRTALDHHELCVYFTNRTGRFGLLRLAFRALLGRLDQDKDFNALDTQEVIIDANRPSLRVALDGEVFRLTPPLLY